MANVSPNLKRKKNFEEILIDESQNCTDSESESDLLEDDELFDSDSEYEYVEEDSDEEINVLGEDPLFNSQLDEIVLSADLPKNYWRNDVGPIPNYEFESDKAGSKTGLTNESTPREFFDKLFTKDVTEMFVTSTNHYGKELFDNPTPRRQKIIFHETNESELHKFIGLCLLMGQSKCPTIRHAFSKHPLYFRPIFSATMSGRRFQMILRTFSCHKPMDQNEINSDRLSRVKPLLDLLLKIFNDAYKPGKRLSLDESLLLHRGRLLFRQYIKTKAAKYGIKFYELTTSDGYVLNITIYKGADVNSIEKGSKTANIVLQLMQPYLNKGHHLFMDNFYNSVDLSTHLLSKKTHTTGTLRSNRRSNPKDVVNAKLKKGEFTWQRLGNVYVTKWKDQRDVLSISTAHHPELVNVENRYGVEKIKPQDVAEYNQYMSGVDRLDQMISYYSTPRKTIRWYKKVLFHLIDVTIWNAYYLYKLYHPKTSFLVFRDSLIMSLIQLPENIYEGQQLIELAPSLGRSRIPKPEALESELDSSLVPLNDHVKEKIPIPASSKRKYYYLRCKICNESGIRKETSHRCKDCPGKPPLCLLCFENHKFNLEN